MIIANPLYDVIFKYLLEDMDIAKELLSNDKHKLDFTGDTNEPIVQKMLNRLQRAIADDDMRHKMDFEDEIERILEREAQKVSAEKDQIIAEKDEALAEKEEIIAGKDAELEALRQIIASMNKNNLE